MTIQRALALACVFCIVLGFATSLNAGQDLNFEREKMRTALQAVSKEIESNFYDSSLRNLNWKQLTEEAKEKINHAENVGQMVTAIFSLVNKLDDSHTVFLPPGRAMTPKFGFEAKAFGDEVRVYEVKKGGAAAAAGLKPGDVILTVNGFNALRENFDLMMLYFHALQPVKALEISYRRGSDAPQTVRVEAQMKQRSAVTDLSDSFNIWELVREAEADDLIYKYSMQQDDIGYVKVPSFMGDDIGQVLEKVKKSRAMIIDLRGNPGGRIDTLANFVGYFHPDADSIGEIVQRSKTEPLKYKPRSPNFTAPVVVMIDSRSASAAEIFARHMQKSGRATIIGDRSSGRVTVARFYAKQVGNEIVMPYGVQIAIGRMVLPGGEELEKRGVKPDVVCIPRAADLAAEHDVCRQGATAILRKALGLAENPAIEKLVEKKTPEAN